MICADRQIERGGAEPGDRAQHVALRDDARLGRLERRRSRRRGRRHRRPISSRPPCRASASSTERAGVHEDRRRPHDVAIAVAVGIAVEALQGPLRIGARRRLDGLDPAAPRLIVEHGGEREAGPFGLGDGADAVLAQLRHQRQKYPRRRDRVAEGGMPVGDVDARARRRASPAYSRPVRARRSAPAAGYRACAAATTAGRRDRIHASAPQGRSRPCARSPRPGRESLEARPDIRERAALPRPPHRRCRECASSRPGSIHRPAAAIDETNRRRRACRPTAAPPASSITRALRGSSPVVSVSMTTASSDKSGAPPLVLSIAASLTGRRATQDEVMPRHPRAMPVAARPCPCARSIRHGCCTG